jgi:hypothetical protein
MRIDIMERMFRCKGFMMHNGSELASDLYKLLPRGGKLHEAAV